MKLSYGMEVLDVLDELIFHLNSKFEVLGGNKRVEGFGCYNFPAIQEGF
jgi:hypothetical protein